MELWCSGGSNAKHDHCNLWLAGSYDHFLNFQIGFVIIMQVSMAVFCAVASYIWRQNLGYDRFFLGFDSYTQVRFTAFICS